MVSIVRQLEIFKAVFTPHGFDKLSPLDQATLFMHFQMCIEEIDETVVCIIEHDETDLQRIASLFVDSILENINGTSVSSYEGVVRYLSRHQQQTEEAFELFHALGEQ